MLLYTNEEQIARRIYSERNSTSVSLYDIEDFIHDYYPNEKSVSSNDINNIHYEYLRIVDSGRCDAYSSDEVLDEAPYASRYTRTYSSRYTETESHTIHGQYTDIYIRPSKIRNFIFHVIGILVIFQCIVMFSDSITWGSLIEDFRDPDEIVLNLIGFIVVSLFGKGVGKLLQVIYELCFCSGARGSLFIVVKLSLAFEV